MTDYTVADTIYQMFTTRAFATGIPTVLAGTPVVSAYENDSATQITAGITLGVDHDSVVGMNLLTIVATGANGFETGKDYNLVITTGTVDSVSVVGEVVGKFSLGRSAAAVSLAAGVNVVQISGDATAADNLELQYDTTGLAGDNFPATQAQISGISNVGSAVNTSAASYTLTAGTQSSGTVSSTAALDGTNHEHTDTAGAMELYYEFSIGSGTPSSVTVTGYVNGNNDSLDVFGYDWVAAGWVQIGVFAGKAASTNEVQTYDLFTTMVGTGGDQGTVRLRFFAASGLSTATLAVDQIFCSFSQGASGYDNGAIWLDTTASNTNTVSGVDGVATNPVSTTAAANTLSANLNLNRFEIAPGSSVTLAAAHTGQLFMGHGWTLALGGQNIDESHFFSATVSGIATAANEMEFHDCEIGTASFQKAHCYGCTFDGTVTFTLAGDYHLINSQSGVAGSGAPTFTKAAGQAITAEFRRWSGGVTFSGLESGDTLTISGELGTVTLNGADAAVEIRGTYKALVNNMTGSPAVNVDGAVLAADVAAILVDTGTTLPATLAALNDIAVADILAMVYEGAETLQDYLRLSRAPLLGKANGLETTTANYRDAADTKNRVVATVDANGNRSAVTTDAT